MIKTLVGITRPTFIPPFEGPETTGHLEYGRAMFSSAGTCSEISARAGICKFWGLEFRVRCGFCSVLRGSIS